MMDRGGDGERASLHLPGPFIKKGDATRPGIAEA